MTNLAERFNILRDSVTGAGEAPVSRIEGEAAAGQEGLIAFSFKDQSGNVVLPQLDSLGRLPVTSNAGTCEDAYDLHAAGSVGVLVDLDDNGNFVQLTPTIGDVYTNIRVRASATTTSRFVVEYVDDLGGGGEAITVLDEIIVGPGQYTFNSVLDCLEVDTTGGTNVQSIRVRAENLFDASCLSATIAALKVS